MMLGMAIGFAVGILPGLGGATTLALMLPFIYNMDPITAFAFLLGSNAVTVTTGDITSVLFGVPGEGITAATIVDGALLEWVPSSVAALWERINNSGETVIEKTQRGGLSQGL